MIENKIILIMVKYENTDTILFRFFPELKALYFWIVHHIPICLLSFPNGDYYPCILIFFTCHFNVIHMLKLSDVFVFVTLG